MREDYSQSDDAAKEPRLSLRLRSVKTIFVLHNYYLASY